MKRWTILLVSLAALAVPGHVVTAQQPRGEGGDPDDRPARRERSARDDGNEARAARRAPARSGIVSEFNKNPDGDTAGLRLDDGTEVRFPPSAGEKVTSGVALHDRVTIEGWTHPGESEIHAATIKNETSGKAIVVDRPPPEVAQSAERSRQGGPTDRADDRKPARGPEEGGQDPQAKREQKPKPKGRESGKSPAGETANPPRAKPAPAEAKPAPSEPAKPGPVSGFVLRSSEVAEGGMLPKEFTGKAYGPDKPIWHYEAKNRTDFFSSEISGAHRLSNGNTLICGGIVGNLFEVTPSGEMVWQYVNPMVRQGILAQGELPGKDMRGHLWNVVFKVHRYEPNYPGLAGRDLTPQGVIELPSSMKGKTGLHLMTEEQRTDRGPDGKGKSKSKGKVGERGADNRDDRPPRDEQRRE